MERKASDRYRKLKKETQRLAAIARKRVIRMQNAGVSNPAIEKILEQTGGKFGTTGRDKHGVRTLHRQLTDFLNNQISTIKGYKATFADILGKLATKKLPIREAKFVVGKIFDTRDKLMERIKADYGLNIYRGTVFNAVKEALKEEENLVNGIYNEAKVIEKAYDLLLGEKLDKVEQEFEGFLTVKNYDWIKGN